MKNLLKELNITFELAEGKNSELEDMSIEIIHSEEQRSKRMRNNEQSFRELWDPINCTNMCMMEVPKGQERKKGAERIL